MGLNVGEIKKLASPDVTVRDIRLVQAYLERVEKMHKKEDRYWKKDK